MVKALNQGNISQQVARTEKVQNCLNPKFAKKFVIDYYFEIVQKLRFGIYDIDNKTIDLSDDDFLGQLEITLGQVRHSYHVLEGHDSSVHSVMFVPICALSLYSLLINLPAVVHFKSSYRAFKFLKGCRFCLLMTHIENILLCKNTPLLYMLEIKNELCW